jgi:signal peptidase I
VLRLVATVFAALAVVAAGYGGTKTHLHCGPAKLGCEGRHPKRGDIVVFRAPRPAATRCGARGIFVKRIVALPGETWSERGGFVYVGGRKLREPYLRPGLRDHLTRPPTTVPRDAYFVLGDNRSTSCDSRVWGPLPRANLVGTVVRSKRTG